MLSKYLEQLLSESRQMSVLLEEVCNIAADVEASNNQVLGRIAGLGRVAQQEQSRSLQQAYEPVRYVQQNNPSIPPPPQQSQAQQANPNVAAPPHAHFVEYPAKQQAPAPRHPPPSSPISQHPIPSASYQLRDLLKNTEDAVKSFLPGRAAPPPVPPTQQKRTG